MSDVKIFKEFQDLRDWIEANTDQKDAEKAVKWFVAMFEAETIQSSYRQKDLAALLLDGTKPIDEEYVNNFLYTLVEDLEVIEPYISSELADDQGVPNLEEELQEFFDV